MNILQNLLLPHLAFHAPEEMYARLHNEKAIALFSEKKIIFKEGGTASFDTFFNSVTIQAWKKNCQIDDLALSLQGKGEFVLRIGLHRIGYAHAWLSEQIITLSENSPTIIPVAEWANLKSGMLYFQLQALSSGELTQGCWITETAPQHNTKLGIVITHFNRKQWVLPAIKRIHSELLSDPLFKGKVELVVVDNSQNITTEELGNCTDGITVLPNQNLGGSGGFTRGLLHLKDCGGFTHCLFMDDDASCEIDGIKRAYNLLNYGKIDRLAIAGSLLREAEPFRLFEKAAQFDGFCKPLKSGMDMRQIIDLLFAELEDQAPDYGGWWFFAFPIQDVKKYAFPFFVRGDDSKFSLDNQFPICTMNGIACWAEDFALKAGPLPAYLDARYHLVYAINKNDRGLAKKLAHFFIINQLYSYNYASAKACRLAIEHVMQGPDFFAKNMDTKEIRQEIGSFAHTEKMQPINRAEFNVTYRSKFKESKLHRWIRSILLNGFLLPKKFLRNKNTTLFQHKSFHGNTAEIYRFQRIIYEYEPDGLGYIAEYDKEKFFSEYNAMKQTIKQLNENFDKLHQQYTQAMPHLTSEAFWRDIYNQHT